MTKNIRQANLIKKKASTALVLLLAMICVASSVLEVSAASLKVSLSQGDAVWYDDGNAYTYKKYVTYKKNGKKYKKLAFCLQPKMAVPSSKSYTAKSIGEGNDMTKVMYFVDGAPGESLFRDFMKSKNLTKYIKTADDYYAFMHITLAYAYEGKKAFKIYGGGSLSSKYQSAVTKAYNYCNAFTVANDAGFAVKNGSSNSATAEYDSKKNVYTTVNNKFTVSGAKAQSFSYTVPKNATLYLKQSGNSSYSSYAAGKSVTIKYGASFYFELKPSVTKGFSSTVKGKLGSLTAYKITATSSTQNLAFFADSSSESASFSVTVNAFVQGKVQIKKATKSLAGEIKPESGAKFVVYNKTYGSYEDALAKNTDTVKYATTLTTGTDGTATSCNLYAGTSSPGNTYVIEQTYSKSGYKLAESRTVTLKGNGIVLNIDENQDYIINEQNPLKIKIQKADVSTKSLITSGTAEFKIYSDEECTSEVATLTTENGVATSENLDEGIYYIKETSAPDGYDVNTNVEKVTLSYDTATLDNSDQTYYLTKTIEDSQKKTHDLYITKDTEGNLWESAHSGTATSDQLSQLKSESYTFNVKFSGMDASTTYSYQIITGDTSKGSAASDVTSTSKSFTTDSDGSASVDVTISPYVISSSNKCYVQSVAFKDLPSSAKYQIKESGVNYLGGSVPYTASYRAVSGSVTIGSTEVTSVNDKISMKQNTGNPGTGVSTETESFENINNENYAVVYKFLNSAKTTHKLVINKKVAGADANKEDEFKFAVILNNLSQNSDNSYAVPGYTIYSVKDDKKTEVSSVAATTASSNTETLSVKLKADESMEINGIDTGVIYEIKEAGSDYIPTYKKYSYNTGDNAGEATEENTGKANTALSMTGNFTSSDASITDQIDFTNTMPDEETYNEIKVNKKTNDSESKDAFDFEVNLSGLKENTTYAAIISGSEDDTDIVKYVLADDGNYGIKVVQETEEDASTDTEATDDSEDSSETEETETVVGISGVPMEIIRSDGKVKRVTTGEDGILDLEGYINWITAKDSTAFQLKILDKTVDMEVASDTDDEGVTTQYISWVHADGTITTNGIKTFQSNSNGDASVAFSLKNGCTADIERLPVGTKYTVTEEKGSYTPSYVAERKSNLKKSTTAVMDEDKSDAGKALETDEYTFKKDDANYTDTITYTNKLEIYDIEVNKETSDQSTDTSFKYDVTLDNLTGDSYIAVVPGTGTFDLAIDYYGNLTVSQTAGDTTDLSNIPMTITRSDGSTRIVRTDSSGKVAASKYADWLAGEETETFDFDVTFLGTVVTMKCTIS